MRARRAWARSRFVGGTIDVRAQHVVVVRRRRAKPDVKHVIPIANRRRLSGTQASQEFLHVILGDRVHQPILGNGRLAMHRRKLIIAGVRERRINPRNAAIHSAAAEPGPNVRVSAKVSKRSVVAKGHELGRLREHRKVVVQQTLPVHFVPGAISCRS